jgi:hypothetical protein
VKVSRPLGVTATGVLDHGCFEVDAFDVPGRAIGGQGTRDADPAAPMAVIFGHVHRNQRVYQAVDAGHLHGLVYDALHDHHVEHGIRLPAEIVAEYHTSALVGLVGWWVRAGVPHGSAGMAGMCREMIQPGAMVVLHGPAAQMHGDPPR